MSTEEELPNERDSSLIRELEQVKGSEQVVAPPLSTSALLLFSSYEHPVKGEGILLVIPTENEFKKKLLQDFLRKKAPVGTIVNTIIVPIDSDVGEQPYNEQGVMGAYNRINNAIIRLKAPEYENVLKEKAMRIIFVASIESYFQTANIDRPTGYGIVVIHNVTSGQTVQGISCRVTVPPEFVDRARQFGREGHVDNGKATVGQILAANVEGLDKKDWQKVLAGKSRYALLEEAIGQLSIPL
jgi:non-canonical (house-cleaning) NTP pyrophosphatase